jgi:hypothetical protein
MVPDNVSVKDFKSEIHDDYIWICVDYGSSNPRRDTLVDINTLDQTENKRESTQAELIKQSFFLYSFKTNLLYLSNSKHISMFTKVLKEKLGIDITIKSIYKTKEEFLKIIKEVDKISFSNYENLFSQNSRERKALVDLTGTDAPESFSIEAKYKKQNLKDIFPFLQKLFIGQSVSKLSNLIISGLDETGFQAIYNSETFTNKLSISANKTSEGLFDNEIIKKLLLGTISNEG